MLNHDIALIFELIVGDLVVSRQLLVKVHNLVIWVSRVVLRQNLDIS